MENTTRITSDDLLIEILKRIPAKTLTRFRCVSKHWNHLIRRRADFSKTHYNYSKTHPAAAAPTVILFSFSNEPIKTWIFYTINDEGEAHHHLTIDISKFGFDFNPVTPQSINGIVCLFDSRFRKAVVCNVATGETVGLPFSSLGMPYWYTPQYSLGFDPENNEYKVLCVWTHDYDGSRWTAEVFTVGAHQWRNIDTLPGINNSEKYFKCYLKSACVNGVIYWETKFDDGVKSGLVSFNVKHEKFQITELPQNIWAAGLIGHDWAQAVHFKGHLALVNHAQSQLLMLGDDDEIRIHGFKKDFELPSRQSNLIITRNSERFFVFDEYNFRLIQYENDGALVRSTRITGLKEAYSYRSTLQSINEHVENIYPLTRN